MVGTNLRFFRGIRMQRRMLVVASLIALMIAALAAALRLGFNRL